MKGPFVPRYVRFTHKRVNRFLHRYVHDENALLLMLSFVVGIGSGLGARGFEWIIETFQREFEHMALDLPFGPLSLPIGNVGALILGGLVGGVLLATLLRSSRGHGVPDVMASVAIRGGRIPPRVAADTAITAGICIGAGGSAGPEGPIVQIGSSIGSTVGRIVGMSTERLRVLAACGAAGGISAIFGAPLAGVFFAVEIILGDFGVQTLTPIVLSSVLAAVTHQIFVSWTPRFAVPHHGFIHVREVPLMLLLGVLAALVSWLFIRFLYFTEDRFRRWRFPAALKPALGMTLVGVLAFAFPQVLGDGYDTITAALNGHLALWLMVALVLAKLLATCFTVGSGNVGGLFAPSLVIGAMLGGSFGALTEHFLRPGEPGIITVYALVGMAAVIAGTTHATITAVLLIFELTNDYAIILPTMLACATAVVLAGRLKRESIYTLALVRAGIQLKRGVEVNVMGSLRVGNVMREVKRTIPYHMHYAELMRLVEDTTENTFPVIDGDGKLAGILSYQDIRNVITQERSPEMDMLVVAGDIATQDPVVVTADQSLNDAMRLFGMRDLSMLPVVESEESRVLTGVLYRRDVLNSYRRALMERAVPDLDEEKAS